MMDSNRFDNIGRALAERASRRGAAHVLAGAILGALAGLPAGDAPAKPKKKKKGCPKQPCPRGQQRNKRTCACECKRTPCHGGMEFDVDSCRCRCPRDLRECRDGCVGKDECCPSDPPCPEDPKGCCHSPGVEVCTIDGCCPELNGLKACNNFCVDTSIDPHHCGDCNVHCASGEPCVNGQCGEEECPHGQPKCGDQCCGFGELCCGGVCRFTGTAICTRDGWCSTTEGQACCVGSDCIQDPCCRFSAGEGCCVTSLDPLETTCCPGGPGQCAPGGCCPVGTTWGDCATSGGGQACCADGVVNCNNCVAVVPGRG